MSFPKAKLSRFNEIKNDFPSPTRYDPKLQGSAKLCTISKSERGSSSDTQSNIGTPFRTPFTVTKKHSCVAGSTEKYGPKVIFPTHDQHVGSFVTDNEEISALKTEVANKTETIHNLEKHVQELSQEIEHLRSEAVNSNFIQSQIESLTEERDRLLAETQNLKTNISNIELKYNTDMKTLVETSGEIKLEKSNLESLHQQLVTEKQQIELKITELESHVMILKETVRREEDKVKHLCSEKQDLLNQIAQLKNEIETLNEKLKQSLSDIERLNAMSAKLESEKQTLEQQYEMNKRDWLLEKNELSAKVDLLQQQMEALIESHLLEAEDLKNSKETELAEIRKEFESDKIHLEDVIINLREENGELFKKMDALNENIEEITNKFENVKREKFMEEKTHKEAILQIKEEHERISKNFEQNLEVCKMEKSQFQKNILDLEERISEKCHHAERLETAKNELAVKINQLENVIENLKHDNLTDATKLNRTIETLTNEKIELEQKHKEALFKLQDEHEKELVARMNKFTDELMERDSKLKITESNYKQNLVDLEEKHLALLNKLKSDHAEKVNLLNAEFEGKRKELQVQYKELEKNYVLEQERYKVAIEEIQVLSETIRIRNDDLEKAHGSNNKLQDRIKNMLEEVKLLNKEIDSNNRQMDCLRKQFEDERHKNERLSEQLGGLDSKLVQLQEDLQIKISEVATARDDAAKQRTALHDLKMEHLQVKMQLVDLQTSSQSALELAKKQYASDLANCQDDLSVMKQQCRNYEIAMADTRSALNALSARLIASEEDVMRLSAENSELLGERNAMIELKEQLLRDSQVQETCLEELRKEVQKVNSEIATKERDAVEQVNAVSLILAGKLAEFEKFFAETFIHLQAEIDKLSVARLEAERLLSNKAEELDNLLTDHDILKTTYEIAQKETEHLKKQFDEQRVECDKLIVKLNLIEADKKDSDRQLAEVLSDLEKTLKQLEITKNENENYKKEIAEKTTHIELLTEETLDRAKSLSETQSLLTEAEKTIDAYKKELHQLSDNFVLANDESRELKDKLEEIKKSVKELETSKEKLTKALDDNLQLEEKVKELTEKDQKLSNELELLKGQAEFKSKWESLLKEKEDLSNLLKEIEDRKDYYKRHCQNLEKKLEEVENDRKVVQQDFEEIDKLLSAKDSEAQHLRGRIIELENLIGPFREQLEQYETERMLIENDRDLLKKQHLEHAAKLGHQNHKQKIQHVVKLKNEIFMLKEENTKLQVDIKSKAKTIEKLREELGEHPKRLFIGGRRPTSTPFKGKENDSTLPLDHTVVLRQEPKSPLNTLRNRNQ